MNKKLITALLAAVLTITTTNTVVANSQPATVAILDTALNANLPVFKDRIVQEVCILEWNSCPNGKNYMEGPGAAMMDLNQMARNGFNHGTKMAHASILTNPNIKIVFVRIVGATPSGTRQITNEATFVNALNWVLNNKNRYNISAVAMSQGHGNLMSGSDYCPKTTQTQSLIAALDSSGTPVFLPAGNSRNQNRIFWPACIKESIAVSASANGDGIAIYSNYDKNLTDMFALGRLRVSDVNGFLFNEDGTSVSTQVAAAIYVGLKNKNSSYTKNQILEIMKLKSSPVISKTVTGYIVKVEALNG
jgi:hypothetical protein